MELQDYRPNFSKIKEFPPNIDTYPLYYHSKNIPYEFTITEGQCLYIPKSWWHWVFTYKDTISVTNWDTVDISDSPYVLEKDIFQSMSKKWTNEYLATTLKQELLYCYFTKSTEVLSCDFDTLINQPFYFSSYSHIENKKITSLLQQDIHTLYEPLETKKPWYNLWFSPTLEEIDSGLHFDQGYSNYMIVLRGKKKVILFPPENTQYLYKNP
jgi:hypothetical protein